MGSHYGTYSQSVLTTHPRVMLFMAGFNHISFVPLSKIFCFIIRMKNEVARRKLKDLQCTMNVSDMSRTSNPIRAVTVCCCESFPYTTLFQKRLH